MRTQSTHRRMLSAFAGAAAIAAMGVAGCGGSDGGSASASPDGGGLKAGDTVKVGYAAGQSGWLAIFDLPLIQGLKTAVNDINASGGIDGKVKIDLDIRDMKSDPSTGAVVAQELLAGGAQILITPCDVDTSLPAAQLAQKEKVPVINACGSSSAFPAQVGDYAFLNTVGTVVEGQAIAEYIKDEGYKNVYLMSSSDNDYTDSIGTSATKTLEKIGGAKLIGTQQYKFQQPSYMTQATKIASAKPELVLAAMFLPDSVTFLKNLRAAGYKGPVIGPDGMSPPETFGAGSAAKNLTTFTFSFPNDDPAGQLTKKFNALFAKSHGGKDATMVQVAGGDVGCLIDNAVKTAGSTNPTKVRDAIASAVDWQCPGGPITYKGRNGVPKKDLVVQKTNAAGTAWEFVKRFYPSSAETK